MSTYAATPEPRKARQGWHLSSPRHLFLLCWAAVVVCTFALLAHANGIFALSWETRPIPAQALAGPNGHAFSYQIGSEWMSASRLGRSPAQILEDGRALPIENAPYPEQVQNFGEGRYRFDGSGVIFSASDNTDPRTNGRSYAIHWPAPVAAWVLWSALSLSGLLTVLACAAFPARVRSVVTGAPFPLVVLPFAALFVLGRLPFWLDYPIPLVWPDSAAYYQQAQELLLGKPMYMQRVPLPALLLAASQLIGGDNPFVFLALQQLLLFASALFLLFQVYMISKPASWVVSIVLALSVNSGDLLELQFDYLSESIYVSLLLTFFALLVSLLRTRKLSRLVLLSAVVGLLLWTRSAGWSMVPVLGFLAVVLALQGWPWIKLAAMVGPAAALVAGLSSYNYLHVGSFALEPALGGAGDYLLSQVTQPFWPDGPNEPAELAGLARYMRSKYDPGDLQKLDTTWDAAWLLAFFNKRYDPRLYACTVINEYSGAPMSLCRMEPDNPAWLGNLVRRSIRHRPDLYFKFIYSNLYAWFVVNAGYDVDVYRGRIEPVAINYLNRPFWLEIDLWRGFLQYLDRHGIGNGSHAVRIVHDGDVPRVDLRVTPAYNAYSAFFRMRSFVYPHAIWGLLSIGLFVLSGLVLLSHRFRHDGALLLFTLGLVSVGAALMVAISSAPLSRYVVATEWIYFVAAVLTPVLLWRKDLFEGQQIAAPTERAVVVGWPESLSTDAVRPPALS